MEEFMDDLKKKSNFEFWYKVYADDLVIITFTKNT